MSENREAAYDTHISPLMAQIIALCKEHDIPMVAQFQINDDRADDVEPFYCTTALTAFSDTSEHLIGIARQMRPPRPSWAGVVRLASGESVQVTGSDMTDADTERAVARLSELARR